MSKKLISVFIAGLLFQIYGFAQTNWNLARSWGGTAYEAIEDVVADGGGNMYFTGSFTSPTLPLGTTTLVNNGLSDLFIAKADAGGNILWAAGTTGASANDLSHAIAIGPDNKIFITGYFYSASITFNSAPGSGGGSLGTANSNPGTAEGFIAAYDGNTGVLQWVRTFNGTGDEFGWGICTDAASVYINGFTASPTVIVGSNNIPTNGNNKDIIHISYSMAGAVQWATVYGGIGEDVGEDITFDGQNLFTVNAFRSTTISYGNIFNNTGQSDIIVGSIDPATGAINWSVAAAGAGTDYAYAITADGNGGIYTHGRSDSGTLTYTGSSPVTNLAAPSTGAITVKFRAIDGIVEWGASSQNTGNLFAEDIVADGCQNVYVTGTFQNTPITFGSQVLNPTGGIANTYIVRYASQGGNVLSAYSPVSSGPFGSHGNAIALVPRYATSNEEDLVVGGRFDNTITFGTTPALNAVGGSDIYLARCDESGSNWSVSTMNSNRQDWGNDITTDAFGNIFVAGTFELSTTFPSSAGNVTITDPGDATRSAYIAKFDPCGNLLWVNFEDISGSCEGLGIYLGKLSGKVYMTGPSTGDIRFQSVAAAPGTAPVAGAPLTANGCYIAEFDAATGAVTELYSPNNAAVATRDITGSYSIFGGTTQLYVCGSFNNGTAIVPLVSRLNDAGAITLAWSTAGQSTVTNSVSVANGIALNSNESRVYITGEYQKYIQFPGIAAAPASTAINDGFIAAFNTGSGAATAGYLRTARAAAGERASGFDVVMDNLGQMCYTGYFSGGTSNFYGFGVTVFSGAGIRRAYTLCVNNNAFVWRTGIFSAGFQVEGHGLATNNGDLYVTGIFNGGALNFPANGAYTGTTNNRVFVARLNSAGVLTWGNTTTSAANANSQQVSSRITHTPDFLYTTGGYGGQIGYSNTNPPLPANLLSTSIAGNNSPNFMNTFIVRNSLYNGGDFRHFETAEQPLETEYAHPGELQAWPNPNNGMLNIRYQAENPETAYTLEVFDISGRQLKRETMIGASALLDLSDMPRGMYILRLTGDRACETKTIVRQ